MTNHPHETPECCAHDGKKKTPWYRSGLFVISAVTAALYGASAYFPLLAPFKESLIDYFRMIGGPVALGFILGGLVDYYVPKEYISKYLARRDKRTVFYAAGLGFLMSACSHGILALAIELHKKGASGPAVVSFLLASPWANLPITILLIGFFGAKGCLIILAALLVAVLTGLLFQFLDSRGWIEKNRHSVLSARDFSIRKDITARWGRYSFSAQGLVRDAAGIGRGIYDLVQMVLWWVLLGVLLASLASAFVPPHFFHRFFGPTLGGLAATLLAATILEVCSEGTSPLAFEIYKQTGAFGNAFAFLMGGVVTDYTEIGLIWQRLGRRTALWMLVISIPQVLALGWLFNTFLS